MIAHILAATLEVMGVENMESTNSFPMIPTELQRTVITDLAHQVVKSNVNLYLIGTPNLATGDRILDCLREVLTLALMYAAFDDAIREGDRDQVIRCWKFLQTYRSFKTIGTVLYLTSTKISSTTGQAWSRVINTHGMQGGNVPMDLHMEHLNRSVKTAVAHLAANTTPKAIVRIGKCIGPLTNLGISFDLSTGVANKLGAHSDADVNEDIAELTSKSRVVKHIPGHKHNAFTGSLLDSLNNETTNELDEGSSASNEANVDTTPSRHI